MRILLSLLLALFLPAAVGAQQDRVPKGSALEPGDFLWPKMPNAIVPYDSQAGVALEAASTAWERERRAHLETLEGRANVTAEEKERYALLSSITYEQFQALFLDDTPVDGTRAYGANGTVSVGHVAIVEIRNGVPWIIEAMIKKGVQAMTYEEWLKGRPGEHVWQGRLRDSGPTQRAGIASAARKHLEKPYAFWNFDLLDVSGFYCSKLAWLSVREATGVILDDKPSPKRALWYSPKQMQKSGHIDFVFRPGGY